MIAFVFFLSMIAAGFALIVPGYADMLRASGIGLLMCLWLLLKARLNRSKPPRPPSGVYIIVDGSNVLHWDGGTPKLETVMAVTQELEARGFTPGVMFDANVGYKIGSRYQDDRELARRLGVTEDRVLVVPKGSPADRSILQAARKLGAKVVTNDRYRDWAEEFPEVAEPGLLVWGGVKDGKVWLKGLPAAFPQGLEAAKAQA